MHFASIYNYSHNCLLRIDIYIINKVYPNAWAYKSDSEYEKNYIHDVVFVTILLL